MEKQSDFNKIHVLSSHEILTSLYIYIYISLISWNMIQHRPSGNTQHKIINLFWAYQSIMHLRQYSLIKKVTIENKMHKILMQTYLA